MNQIQSSYFEGFKRVAGFGQKYAADMRPVPPSTEPTKAQKLFAQLGTVADINHPEAPPTVVGILGRADRDQMTGKGGSQTGTVHRGQLREALRGALRDVRRGALSIARERRNKDVLANFKLPEHASDRLLATTVRSFASAAEPLRALFVELEYPPDFIERMQADLLAFENSSQEQNSGRSDKTGASGLIVREIERGTGIVTQLDTIMRNKYRAQPEMLAVWQAHSRLGRRARVAAAVRIPAATGPASLAAVIVPKARCPR